MSCDRERDRNCEGLQPGDKSIAVRILALTLELSAWVKLWVFMKVAPNAGR
jgi:hypothetical protein